MRKTYLVWGEHNVICDGTGFKLKSSQVEKRWDGRMIRKDLIEERQSQDLIRSVRDDQGVRNARTEPEDVFITEQVLPSSL